MTTYRLVYNPTGGPQPADDAGRVVGAGEFDVAHAAADQVKAALAADRLVEPQVGDNVRPDVAKLLDRVDELERRSDAFAALEAGKLAELAGASGLPAHGLGTTKAELVHALTMHPSAQAPARKQPKE